MNNIRKPIEAWTMQEPFGKPELVCPEQPVRQLEQEHQELLNNIEKIFTVLDEYLGDTDPFIDHTWTDEEIKTNHPITWVAKKLIEQLKKGE